MENIISHIDMHAKKIAVAPETDDGNNRVDKTKDSKIKPGETITGSRHNGDHATNDMHHVMHAIHFENAKQQAILSKRRQITSDPSEDESNTE
jgi:hypothetical protein